MIPDQGYHIFFLYNIINPLYTTLWMNRVLYSMGPGEVKGEIWIMGEYLKKTFLLSLRSF